MRDGQRLQTELYPTPNPAQPQLFPAGRPLSCEFSATDFASICESYCLSPEGWSGQGPAAFITSFHVCASSKFRSIITFKWKSPLVPLTGSSPLSHALRASYTFTLEYLSEWQLILFVSSCNCLSSTLLHTLHQSLDSGSFCPTLDPRGKYNVMYTVKGM